MRSKVGRTACHGTPPSQSTHGAHDDHVASADMHAHRAPPFMGDANVCVCVCVCVRIAFQAYLEIVCPDYALKCWDSRQLWTNECMYKRCRPCLFQKDDTTCATSSVVARGLGQAHAMQAMALCEHTIADGSAEA
jgi:hypothetical protein